jgi:hypothetical protein
MKNDGHLRYQVHISQPLPFANSERAPSGERQLGSPAVGSQGLGRDREFPAGQGHEPAFSGDGSAVLVQPDAGARRGHWFQRRGCVNCDMLAGVGGPRGPTWTHIGVKPRVDVEESWNGGRSPTVSRLTDGARVEQRSSEG